MLITINDCRFCGKTDQLYQFDTVNRYEKLGGGSMIACRCFSSNEETLYDYYDNCFANVPEGWAEKRNSYLLEMVARWNELNPVNNIPGVEEAPQ